LPNILIGSQYWMDKNLDVTTYRNGDPIPQVTNNVTWANLRTGAWCYYNNDPANGAIYGKLYNWYAVNDQRGLAPQGWHVPSDAEWFTLGTYLGGDSFAGGKMKTTGTTRWTYPNTNASNESGFTGLPGGYRVGGLGTSGAFESLGNGITLWSATESNTTSSFYRYIDYNSGILGRWELNKAFGFSVRLIKD
ncbi:MAG: fibrobacter succinogenes major paralogous domain-containing protein, partial [Sediminibacterium sp.]